MQHHKGTTIMELIIAMGVIIVGLLTVVGLITRSISVGSLTKNEIIALGLAQEGIEATRAIRDSNGLEIESGRRSADEWDYNLFSEDGGLFDYTAIAEVDFDFASFAPGLIQTVWWLEYGDATTTVDSIDDDAAQVLQYDEGTQFAGLFFQDKDGPQLGVSSPSGFRRMITLEPLCEVAGDPVPLAPADLSNAGECTTNKMGVRVTSTVQWVDQIKETPEIVSLQQDIYDWR